MILINALGLSHSFVAKIVKPGDKVVDATCGKGRDTLLLAGLAGENGHVYAFDIQEESIKLTAGLLKDNGYYNTTLFCKNHAEMNELVPAGISCAMFNLGYLPGTNHKLQTKGKTTIKAISAAIGLLRPGGIITIVIYQGGDTGFEERDAVLAYCKGIDQKTFTVQKTSFENQKNNPPIFICIEKIS